MPFHNFRMSDSFDEAPSNYYAFTLDNTGLIAWWDMDEASGTRLDAHTNNYDLTDNNTVGSASGKINNGAEFIGTNSEYLSYPDTNDFDVTTGESFTWVGWFKPGDIGGQQTYITKGPGNVPASHPYFLDTDAVTATTATMNFFAVDGTVVSTSSGFIQEGVWYFVVAWFDNAANTINLQINNGTVLTTSSVTAEPVSNSSPLRVGTSGSVAHFFDGIMDAVSFWKRVLTAEERTYLYNSGNGRAYPF